MEKTLDIASRPTLSVVIPAFNAASTIGATVEKLSAFLHAEGITHEILVVDDGSYDDTETRVPKLDHVSVVRFTKNKGKGAALKEGFGRSLGKVVLFTDADLPYGLELVHQALFYILKRGYHAVVGDRSMSLSQYEVHIPGLRKTLSGICSLFVRTILVGGMFDTQCGFKAFRGDVARAVSKLLRVHRFAVDVEIYYILLKYRLDVKQVPVKLVHNPVSTVRVLRDSAAATIDILGLRWSWSLGRYRSSELQKIFESSERADRAEAQAIKW